jgi:hypothetical protein
LDKRVLSQNTWGKQLPERNSKQGCNDTQWLLTELLLLEEFPGEGNVEIPFETFAGSAKISILGCRKMPSHELEKLHRHLEDVRIIAGRCGRVCHVCCVLIAV